jgi:membrane associated rhomboid family serine protease
MPDHFLVSYSALTEGRYWTLLGSAFSHNMVIHFFINMYVLHSFGSFLEQYLGSLRFLLFYLTAGMVGSLCHALTSAYFLHAPDMPALGASGAVAGVILVFSLMFPREKILLLGIIPLPALFGALLFVGFDIWGLYAQSTGSGLPIGHGAHLGGAVTGLIAYLFWFRGGRKTKHVLSRTESQVEDEFS